jgi:periplasmic protein TonB
VRSALGFAPFVAAAALLHGAAVWVAAPAIEPAPAGGALVPISLSGGDAALEALVESWGRPLDSPAAPRPVAPHAAAGPPVLPEVPTRQRLPDDPRQLAEPAEESPPAAADGPQTRPEPTRISERPLPRQPDPPPHQHVPPRAEPSSAAPPDLEAPAAARARQDPPSAASLKTPRAAQALAAEHAAAVRAAIARAQRYPARALARGQRGTAFLRIAIDRDGRLEGAALARSSGVAALDDAALTAARNVGRFPAAPDDLPGTRFSFEVGVVFDPG